MRAASVAVVAIAAIAAAASVDAGGRGAPPAQAWPASPYEGSPLPADLRVPDVVLRDEEGRPVRLAHLGEPAVVTFGSAVCEETCPLQAQAVRGALDDLGTDVPAFVVAVDPPRDTAQAARRFLLEQRLSGRVRFLVGPRAELERTWRGFAVAPQTAREHHQARIVVTDGAGRQRVGAFAESSTPETVAHDLRVVMRGTDAR